LQVKENDVFRFAEAGAAVVRGGRFAGVHGRRTGAGKQVREAKAEGGRPADAHEVTAGDAVAGVRTGEARDNEHGSRPSKERRWEVWREHLGGCLSDSKE